MGRSSFFRGIEKHQLTSSDITVTILEYKDRLEEDTCRVRTKPDTIILAL